MVELTERIVARIVRDFGARQAPAVAALLRTLELPLHHSPAGDERICGALLIVAGGRFDRLQAAAAEARKDWRDLLVAAGLAYDDWPARLDDALTPQ